MPTIQSAPSVDLSKFRNGWYHPGRSSLVRGAWLFLGLPVLRSPLIPGSLLRAWMLRLFGASVGTRPTLKPGIRVKHPWMLTLGDNVWLGEDCWIDNLAPVTIGSNACLSQGCYVCTGSHDWSDPAFGLIVKPVEIRPAAWVGARAVIAPGVVLEEGAVAAIGSTVIKTIPAWQIHAGSPASFIRHRIIKTPGV